MSIGMLNVILYVVIFILFLVFYFTQILWSKNIFSLAVCLLLLIGLMNNITSNDNMKLQIVNILFTLILNGLIITFILFGKIAGIKLSQIVNERKITVYQLIFSLVLVIPLYFFMKEKDFFLFFGF